MAGSFGQRSTWRNPFASKAAWEAVPERDNAASFQTQGAGYFSSPCSGVQGVFTDRKQVHKCALPLQCRHGPISVALGE